MCRSMKKIDLGKLNLKTTTIRVLNQQELQGVAGAWARTTDTNCSSSCTLGNNVSVCLSLNACGTYNC